MSNPELDERCGSLWQRVIKLDEPEAERFLDAWHAWVGDASDPTTRVGDAAALARSFLQDPASDEPLLAFLEDFFRSL